ncbi:MAG: ATP-binding protein [Patescibacteria group bacterium]|jgi:signal transduction histidine kinase
MFWSVVSFIIVALNLLLGGVVLFYNIHKKANRIFFWLSFFITGWGVSTIVFINYSSFLFARLTFLFGIFIVYTLGLFFQYFPKEDNSKKLSQWILLSLTFIISAISLTSLVVKKFPELEFGYFVYVYIIYFIFLFLLAIYYFIQQYSNATAIQKRQILYIAISFIIGIVLAFTINLIIPIIVGKPAYNHIGVFATLIVIGGMSYSIIKHRLFDIQIQAQRLINTILPVILTIAIVTILAYLFHDFTTIAPVTIGIIVIFTAIVLHALLEYIFNTTCLGYILFSSTFRFHTALTQLSNTASTITDFELLINSIERVFLLQHIQGFAFVVIDDQIKRTYHIYKAKNIPLAKLGIWTESALHQFVYDYFVKTKETLVISELPYLSSPIHTKLQQAFAPLTDGVCIPLILSNDLVGFIILGSKQRNTAYTSEDITVFTKISPALAMAVTKSILFTQYRNRVDELTRERNNLKLSITELQRMKEEFLHIVDHQFNTPLSIIRSAFAMIEEGDVGVQEIQSYIKGVSPRIKEFQSIVQGMLDAAHLEGNTANMNFAPVNVATVLQTVIQQLQPLAQAKLVKLNVTVQPNLPRITSDPEKFTTVLSALIHNAIVYGHDGIVTITATQQPNGHVQIQIQDQGRGFDVEEAKHIGEKFYRGKNIIDYHANGSGLGVHNAKKIVIASGGTLTFTSAGVNKGSCFTINLPKGTEFLQQLDGLQATTSVVR